MVILFCFTCNYHVIRLHLVFMFPVGFLYSNKGCDVPKGCTFDLINGPAGLIDLTKGSHQMFGGILPFVERIRFKFYTPGL
jgi:hypothetical protein